MVIAAGSYPAGRWFESDRRYHTGPFGQAVKTPPFHGGYTGSNPVRVTKLFVSEHGFVFGCRQTGVTKLFVFEHVRAVHKCGIVTSKLTD